MKKFNFIFASINIFLLALPINAMEPVQPNYFDWLYNDLIVLIARELINVSKKDSYAIIGGKWMPPEMLQNAKSFLLTCKRFNTIGKEEFRNHDQIIEFFSKNRNITVFGAAAYLNAYRWIDKKICVDKELVHCKCDMEGSTPLHIAVRKNANDVIKVLIINGVNVDEQDDGGHTPLYKAILHENVEAVNLLITSKANVNAYNKSGEALLQLAIETDNLEIVQSLLGNGARVNIMNERYQKTPLHYAARYNLLKIAEFLLQNNAEIDSKDHLKCTPLHDAIMYNATETAEFLINNKADILATDKSGNISIHGAAWMNNPVLIEMLLKKLGRNFIENPTLTEQSKKSIFGLVKDVVNTRNNEGQTPLMLAVVRDAVEAAKVLIDYGAEVTLKNNGGITPVELALCRLKALRADKKRKEMYELLSMCNVD